MISGHTWGWILIFCGIGQGLVAWGVWAQAKGVRWISVAIATANAILQLLFMPAYPFWSLCLFTLDILVIYGLIVHVSAGGVSAFTLELSTAGRDTQIAAAGGAVALTDARRRAASERRDGSCGTCKVTDVGRAVSVFSRLRRG